MNFSFLCTFLDFQAAPKQVGHFRQNRFAKASLGKTDIKKVFFCGRTTKGVGWENPPTTKQKNIRYFF